MFTHIKTNKYKGEKLDKRFIIGCVYLFTIGFELKSQHQ